MFRTILLRALAMVGTLFVTTTVHAASGSPELERIRAGYRFQDPLGGVSIPELVGHLIAQGLPLVGALFLIVFILSGVVWMTAGGDAKKVQSAQIIMRNAVIGMAIVVGAYVIVNLILTAGTTVLSPGGAPAAQ